MAAFDEFSDTSSGLSSPFRHAEAVTPSDASELTRVSRSIYVGGAGDLVVVTSEGDEVTFASVPAGSWVPGCIKQVKSTGTDATSIVAVS